MKSLKELTNIDSASSSNSKYTLQERRCVGTQQPNSLRLDLLQVVRQSPTTVREFSVASSQDFIVDCNMVDCLRLRVVLASSRVTGRVRGGDV